MLEPQSRTLLVEALKPPLDYRLDFAVGTTFTLDLVALLAAPLAFALLDRTAPDGKLSGDPIALLEALRRNADRFAIFCQVGRIAVPKADRLLLAYLERHVLQVAAPAGGVFHPKVWVQRFIAEGLPVRYRLICASRNLTFDRSWDTVLTLEGDVADRRNAIAANHPLGDFIAALPDWATGEVSPGLRERIGQMAGELRKVVFELPEGFDEYAFFPLGFGKYTRAQIARDRMDRLLVVSPFVSAEIIDEFAELSEGELHLVLRLEALETLPAATLQSLAAVSAFSDEQTDPDAETAEQDGGDSSAGIAEPELSGLHAKLYVADQGWNASVWTGSLNATSAAFHRNVEFMVRLSGRKKDVGIDAFLAAGSGQPAFHGFLRDFTPGEAPAGADSAQAALERALDEARLWLSRCGWRLRAQPADDAGHWGLELSATADAPGTHPDGLAVRAWPISCRPEAMAQSIDRAKTVAARFAPLAFEALTSFIAFDLALAHGGVAGRVGFVLNLPVEGFPQDREQRLLLKLLENRDAVLRYIQMLLADGDAPAGEFGELGSLGGESRAGNGAAQLAPILESLVRMVHREPARLDDVARLVEGLKGAGADRLPPGFEEVWAPIWQARKAMDDEKPAS